MLVTQPNHAAHPYIEHRTLIQSSGPLFHFHLRYFNHRFIHKWTNTFSENFIPAMISHSMRDKNSISNKDRPYISERFLRYSRSTVADLESVIRESCLWGTNRRRFILSNNGQDGPFFSTGRGTSKTQTQAVKHQKIERECLYLNILKKVA